MDPKVSCSADTVEGQGLAAIPGQARALFLEPNAVSVATVNGSGSPRVTPLWVDIEGDHILLNGTDAREWLRNLRRNPEVALSIFDPQHIYRHVNVVGRAVEFSEEGAQEHIQKLARKYTGGPYAGPLQERRVMVKIRPDLVSLREG